MNPEYKRIRFLAQPVGALPVCFGVVTACNPNGVVAEEARNKAATSALRRQLNDAGRIFFPVTGCSPDLAQQEPGFAVVCQTSDEVVELGRAWQQEAVFWVEAGIVHLLPCGAGERSLVGRWEAIAQAREVAAITKRPKDSGGQARRALQKNFTGMADSKGYVRVPIENLVAGVQLEDFEADLQRGAGDELRMKFCALHSSAALAVNTFGPFKTRPGELMLLGSGGFTGLKFERPLPTGLKGTPPNLDVWLEREQEVIAIESKLLEYFEPKEAKFKDSYQRTALPWAEPCWWEALEEAKTAKKRHLDVAQLVKHYCGVSNYLRQKSAVSATLLYLFWEPLNWMDVVVCRQHRAEVEEFAKRVTGSHVKFAWMAYPQLWEAWSVAPLLAPHAANLKARYGVNL
jgi:hypothetical protein